MQFDAATNKEISTLEKQNNHRATCSGQDSAVHLQLKDQGHRFEDSDVHIPARQEFWFVR